MARFKVRPYEDSDREAYGHVRSFVYRGGAEVRADERLLRDDCVAFVVEDEGRIVGSAIALKMTCSIGEVDLSCAGVAGVGILPEERQSGAGTALMEGVVRMCRDLNFQMSTLYPFRETWYRRYGYATAGLRWKIQVPTDRFPKLEAELPIRLLSADSEPLKGVEEAMARRLCGYNKRGPDQWWRSLGGDSPLTIYAAGDPVEAYCVLRLRDDFWGWIEVKEFAWGSEAGYRSMIAQLKRLSMNHLGVIWMEPLTSPYMTRYIDQGVTAESRSPVMYRVLDPDAVNHALGTNIKVNDPLLGLAGDIPVEDFTQAAMGHDSPTLAGLNHQDCYCIDFF